MAVDLIIQKCTCNAHAVFVPIILVSKIGKYFCIHIQIKLIAIKKKTLQILKWKLT
jgi:hypothetical protein